MTSLKLTLASLAFITTFSAFASEITLKTEADLTLAGNYYQSKNASQRAVLMLHQCNYNRTMYNDIGQQLAKHNIHALSIDFRGFGDSKNKAFNIDNIQALPENERRAAWQAMAKHWPGDVQKAYSYLKNKIKGNADIGVIGASCGGSQAITLAENQPIKAIGFFSSGQREKNINRYKTKLADKPTLIIAAENDGRTYTSAQAIFTAAKHDQSKLLSYKGNDHGYPLLDKDTDLANTIVKWFNSQL